MYTTYEETGVPMDNRYSDAPPMLRDFLNYMLTIKGKSENTTTAYFYDLRLFFRFLKIYRKSVDLSQDIDTIPISDVDAAMLEQVTLNELYEYITYVSRTRDNNPASRARKIASVRSFFKYLSNKVCLISHNPANELESPKIPKKLPRYLEVDESKQLLSSIQGRNSIRDLAIITLFLNCGMRLSELVGINTSNLRDDVLTIYGKGKKERNVYLNEACRYIIEKYKEYKQERFKKEQPIDKHALFLSERRDRISKNTVQYIVKKYIGLAKLDTQRYSTHKLRHTAATLMYKYGKVDILTLQQILGHESIKTTEIYTHLDNNQLRDAVNSNPLSSFTPNLLRINNTIQLDIIVENDKESN